jgi:hypothetical protein
MAMSLPDVLPRLDGNLPVHEQEAAYVHNQMVRQARRFFEWQAEKGAGAPPDTPMTEDAKRIAHLTKALEGAREVFDRQVKHGALPHSDWDRMASIAHGNIDRAIAGRPLLPNVFEADYSPS